MAWQPNHKATTRQRIITSAAQLFTHHGFEAISIDKVMSHAGLTRGAFYSHFKNKTELYQEAVIAGAQQAKKTLEAAPTLSANDFAQHYLQIGDNTNPKSYCPLAFFITDIAHQDADVKATYTKALTGYIEILKSLNIDDEKAYEAAILLIGGLAISRAITDDALKNKLKNAAIEGVIALTATTKRHPAKAAND